MSMEPSPWPDERLAVCRILPGQWCHECGCAKVTDGRTEWCAQGCNRRFTPVDEGSE